MSDLLWSILIPTLGYRRGRFTALVNDVLLPQMTGGAEIVGLHNNGEMSIGQYRDALLHDAKGEYVSFVDDDDLVAPRYAELILGALASRPDVVAFEVDYVRADEPPFHARSLNSIFYEPHDDTVGGLFYRDLTHVQPVRADLARKGSFAVGWPEDNAWRTAVLPHLRTEVNLGQVLYYYRDDPKDSTRGRTPVVPGPRAEISSPFFRWLEAE